MLCNIIKNEYQLYKILKNFMIFIFIIKNKRYPEKFPTLHDKNIIQFNRIKAVSTKMDIDTGILFNNV